jgi:hypothetical protein
MMRKALDSRGRALVSAVGNRPRVRVAPYKKPSKADSVGELESDNAPRKKLLAAHSSGRASPRNKPGNAANLGMAKYTEADILKMVHEAKEDIQSEGANPMSTFEYDPNAVLKRAESAMAAGDYANAEELLDTCIDSVTASLGKAKHTPPKTKTLATRDDTADDDGDEDDLGVHKALGDIETALDVVIEKLGGGGSAPVKYPAASVLADHHTNLQPPATTDLGSHGSDGRQTGVSPATGTPSPSAFDVLVQQIAARDGLSKTSALARARQLYPREFQAWQSATVAEPTNVQQTLRAPRVEKAAADPPTFEEACALEIAKGHNPRVAAQRAINKFGNALPRQINKHASDVAAEFRKRADEFVDETSAMPRTEALRAARRADPALYAKLIESAF